MIQFFPLKGGCAVGTHSVSIPYATLDATRNEIYLSFKAGSFSFPAESIVKISPFPGLHLQGIEIVHQDPKLPKPVIFWTFSPDMVREELRALGYKVEDPEC